MLRYSFSECLELLKGRVKFKLYAAEQHLNELKNIKQKHGSIRRSSEIMVKTEMEIDCFLAHDGCQRFRACRNKQ
jgi:hypothetical protein